MKENIDKNIPRETVNSDRKEKRPRNLIETNAALRLASGGVFTSILEPSPSSWVESVNKEEQTTTFSYRGINLPGYTFEFPWIELQGSHLE